MEPVNEDWSSAVAIVAHPDDLEYGMASAVARWTSQGKEVSYVLATSGEAGIAGTAPQEARQVREEEERRSAEVVGVRNVEFLGHRDGEVEYGLALRRDLTGAIRRLCPEVVIAMNFDLTWGERNWVNHADHRAVGLAALDACRDAGNEWVFSEVGPPWRGIGATYVAASEPPTHYVDVTATIDVGIASLREHRAYIDGLRTEFDPDDFLRSMAEHAGQSVGVRYAVLLKAYNSG